MAHEFKHPIIGQEAVCPDGLGRVTAFMDSFPHQWIQVTTYVANRACKWAPVNVQLEPLRLDKDAERYRKLRALAIPNGNLEAFVAIGQLDYIRTPEVFDQIVDEQLEVWARKRSTTTVPPDPIP